ncbi:alpha/beta fold hydrolase [Tuanshanicoccus lijuaniae]|uniref:alpha/beta hydrolase n=1 Tax=Aerococcaceae bacterium zg-1292 TaxID=2774330 RepID=UPI001936B97E|nr:alpha/beta fold hydrolase [Aerococcaceae bacterium zg-1292]QQA36581.1 alpha/beta fold hydrolase [Aerococcaceae bacterium zg-1292]
MENYKFYDAENAAIGVILLHSYTGSPNDFNVLARRFQRVGVEVLCPTFEGHATDDIYDILEAHPEDWWLQAQGALEWMQARDYEQVYVFGLSLGGIFATRLLTEHHEDNLAGGIINSPVYTSKPLDVSYFFEQYAATLYAKQGMQAEYEQMKADILERHEQQVAEIYYFTTSYQMELQEITSRFYIAQSGQDEMVEADDAYLVKEALIRADVDFHWFPENTHVITTNRNRQAFEESIMQFIGIDV